MILFICSNSNHVAMFEPVAEALLTRGRTVQFLSLDQFYQQGASSRIKQTKLNYIELSNPFEIEQWWRATPAQQEEAIEQAWLSVDQLYFENRPEVVVAGNDYGPLEQVCIRTAEAYGALCVRLQDGLQHSPPLTPDSFTQGPTLGDGGCDALLFWSQSCLSQAKLRGVQAHMEVTGNPRFEKILKFRGGPSQQRSRAPQILVATQCFARYGRMSAVQEFSLFSHIVSKILRKTSANILLKLHPQTEDSRLYERLQAENASRITLVVKQDSLDCLATVDGVVTVASSLSVESRLLGIPTLVLSGYLDTTTASGSLLSDSRLDAALEAEDFPSSLNDVPRIDVDTDLHRQLDGLESQRVVGALEDLATLRAVRPDLTPKISVVLVFSSLDSLAPVSSVLREHTIPLELIAVDFSADGKCAKRLRELIDDPRLRTFHQSCESKAEATLFALAQTKADIIARVDAECVVLPGLFREMIRVLEENSDAKVVSGAYGFRNKQGLLEQIHVFPNGRTLAEIVHDRALAALLRIFAFRGNGAELARLAGHLRENFEFRFIAGLIGDLNNPKAIGIVNGALFFSPFTHYAQRSLLTPQLKKKSSALPPFPGTDLQSPLDLLRDTASSALTEALMITRIETRQSITRGNISKPEKIGLLLSGEAAAALSPMLQDKTQYVLRPFGLGAPQDRSLKAAVADATEKTLIYIPTEKQVGWRTLGLIDLLVGEHAGDESVSLLCEASDYQRVQCFLDACSKGEEACVREFYNRQFSEFVSFSEQIVCVNQQELQAAFTSIGQGIEDARTLMALSLLVAWRTGVHFEAIPCFKPLADELLGALPKFV